MFIRTLFTIPVLALLALSPKDTVLDSTWQAHGGLARWQQQRTFQYTMKGFPLSAQMQKPNTSTVDLQSRRNRIDGEGFTVAYDGKKAWGLPDDKAAGIPARFVTLGSFYFIGMPFVFGDPGIKLQELPREKFLGKEYRVVRATYDKGVGYTPDDDYLLYVDPESGRLKLINHTVTELGDAKKRVAWLFDEWQEVNGLVVPKKMTFYDSWNAGKDLGKGKSFTIQNVKLSTDAPDPKLYVKP